MNTLYALSLVVLAAALAGNPANAQMYRSFEFGGENDTHTTLVIKSDGSCTLTNENVESRKMVESQVRSWERYAAMSDGIDSGDDDNATPPPAEKAGTKPLTDGELKSKIEEMYDKQSDLNGEAAPKIGTVEISTNTVRVVASRAFSSLKDLLSQNPYTWGPSVLMAENARFEIDTNHNLRISFTGSPASARYAKSMGRAWKSAKMKFDWKLVLPGKILSSDLPGSQDSTTWINLDSDKTNTMAAALRLIGSNVVIIAEAGGITIDEPLESKKLARSAMGRNTAKSDLPITDAAGGYAAEPVGITISTVHNFPEGEKYLKDRPEAMMYGMGSSGVVVSAKLFPPKGRVIKSVSDLRVKMAKDDKGRPITAPGEGEEGGSEENYTEIVSYNSGDTDKNPSARIELRVGLPAPDAKTIDELDAEAVALTIGSWKEMTLTNVQADAKNEIDLSEVLPGAKLIIKKIAGRSPQRIIQASLVGPAAVGQLEVKIKMNGQQGSQSNMSGRQSKTSKGVTTRNFTIQSFEFNPSGETSSGPLTLIVRSPQDMKRERLQFKLTALDLL